MDFLKWILKTSLLIALMFLGLQPDNEEENAENRIEGNGSFVRVLF
jgi:hypothetical protein